MNMFKLPTRFLLLLLLSLGCLIEAQAQQSAPQTGENDESSEHTEETEEAYRRRMELEGARDQETFTNTSYTAQREQEEIDKLPEESQKNIRKQITDIIIENDQWEPSDVLEDYPYEPTEAAAKDPVLREQEEEAWAEQVDKYHKREAGAFGATRPPMPGNDQQQPGADSSGDGEQIAEQAGKPGGGEGESGQQGEQSGDGETGTAGSYEPYQSGSQKDGDDISTAGVSQSALDFLLGKQGQAPGGSAGSQQQGQAPSLADGSDPQQGQASGGTDQGESPPDQNADLADSGSEQQQSSDEQAVQDSPEQAPDGSLPIEQLEQLQGVAAQSVPAEPQPPGESQQAQADPAEAQAASEQMAQASEQAQAAEAENQNEEKSATMDLNLDTPGIIAIRDLSKLEGVEQAEEEDETP